MARFCWAGIRVLVDGQAGPCMASVHGAGWLGGGVAYLAETNAY